MNQGKYLFLLSEVLNDNYRLHDVAKELHKYIESKLRNEGFIEEIYLDALSWTEQLLEESKNG